MEGSPLLTLPPFAALLLTHPCPLLPRPFSAPVSAPVSLLPHPYPPAPSALLPHPRRGPALLLPRPCHPPTPPLSGLRGFQDRIVG